MGAAHRYNMIPLGGIAQVFLHFLIISDFVCKGANFLLR
jgi:hypothetical protein